MAKVFITQDNGRVSFEGARKFGELVPLVDKDVFPDTAESRPQTMAYIMWSKMKAFDEQEDYLLLAGDPVAIALAVRVLTVVGGVKKIRCLKYDRELRDYYLVNII